MANGSLDLNPCQLDWETLCPKTLQTFLLFKKGRNRFHYKYVTASVWIANSRKSGLVGWFQMFLSFIEMNMNLFLHWYLICSYSLSLEEVDALMNGFYSSHLVQLKFGYKTPFSLTACVELSHVWTLVNFSWVNR